MMDIQTLIDNKDAIPQMLRQAGYLTMANQVEDDLTGLAEELTRYQQGAHRQPLREAMEAEHWEPIDYGHEDEEANE